MVGSISHQSPDYGVIGKGTYSFSPGTYDIVIQHQGTNLAGGPDYDYTAKVEKVGGQANVKVEDPKGVTFCNQS